MKTVLCPGTYDPVTVGHLDVISRCSAMFDEVVVGVVEDSYRKTSLFDRFLSFDVTLETDGMARH